jgi:hypothetical protein
MLRISHCLDNRLTDGGKDVSPYAPTAFYSFLLKAEFVRCVQKGNQGSFPLQPASVVLSTGEPYICFTPPFRSIGFLIKPWLPVWIQIQICYFGPRTWTVRPQVKEKYHSSQTWIYLLVSLSLRDSASSGWRLFRILYGVYYWTLQSGWRFCHFKVNR